jgi:hypothetical protein
MGSKKHAMEQIVSFGGKMRTGKGLTVENG